MLEGDVVTCENCGYENYIRYGDMDELNEDGDFYTISNGIKIERYNNMCDRYIEEATLLFCPSCEKFFIWEKEER